MHPEGKAARTWPDGFPKAHEHVGQEACLTDNCEDIVELDRERREAEARAAEIHEHTLAAVDEVGPEGLLNLAPLQQFVESEVQADRNRAITARRRLGRIAQAFR